MSGDRPAQTDVPREDGGESLSWEAIRRFAESPLRRPRALLVPWAAIFALSALSLFVLPTKYRSSTLILIESEKMPDSFVPKVATEDTRDRLAAIRPEILSRTRLERVLADTRPYPDTASTALAIDKMRKATTVSLSGNDGFTIEFSHSDPRKAQEVTDRIATLFIDETVKSRGQQVEEAVDFLDAQVRGAQAELERKDEALRHFKEQRMGTLPEQLQTNLATLGMLQRELQVNQESLIFARERQEALARSLGRTAGSAAGGGRPTSADTELADLNRQLAALRGRYTDEHPDIQGLRGRIARLQQRRNEIAGEDPAAAEAAAEADPTTRVTREQFDRATAEVNSLEKTRVDLEARLAALRRRVEDTPRTEQELSTLTRDYTQLKEDYATLLRKQREAQMAGRLEQRWKGDRFRVLDPANLPEKPSFPKPWIVLGLGAFLGLGVGLASCLAMELLDPTLKDVVELSDLGGFPVLGRIPHLPSIRDGVTR